MIILGIETSCDETSAGVIKDGREILSNIIASSQDMHAKTGGIIPEQAAREQIKSMIPVVEQSMVNAKLKMGNIDAIAVTMGPGLIGSLLVGVETARTLSYVWKKPLVPINHLVGHIYANWINNTPTLPALALVVSGGHTDLVLLKTHGSMEYIGGTRDDAAGECFDKCARLLGLGFPGGPAISKAATHHNTTTRNPTSIHLPRPLINEKGSDFSFSGLKTAVLREADNLKQHNLWNEDNKNQLAHEIQESITDVLVHKTLAAVKHAGVKTLIIAGGVAANSRLREKFNLEIRNSNLEINLHIPPPELCTDNASMIAAAAEFNYKPIPWQKATTNPSLTIDSVI